MKIVDTLMHNSTSRTKHFDVTLDDGRTITFEIEKNESGYRCVQRRTKTPGTCVQQREQYMTGYFRKLRDLRHSLLDSMRSAHMITTERVNALQSFCMFKDDEHQQIYPVLWHRSGDLAAVVVSVSSSTHLPEEADALTPYDDDGCRLVRFPLSLVKQFLTEEEAASVQASIDADEQLLSYAR